MPIEGRHTDIAQESLHASSYLFALNLNPNCQMVLDVGIGDGVCISRALSWRDAQPKLVVGIDTNYLLLADSPKQAGISRVAGSGLVLPFRDSLFDLVTSSQLIEHVEWNDHPRLMGELVRVTRPGGNLVLATINENFPYNVRGHRDHVAEFNRKNIDVFVNTFDKYGAIDLYAVVPSERYIEAQMKRAMFWMLRPIKDLFPRSLSEQVLTLLTHGRVSPSVDMRGDFEIKRFSDLEDKELFTDFLIKLTKT